MVLADLGRKLQSALNDLNRAPVVDEATVKSIIKEIASALLASDVNVHLVNNLRTKVKQKVVPTLGKSANNRNVLQKAIFDELVALVDPSENASTSSASQPVWKPKKGSPNVVMFVGLQGAGKTTSCTKFAVHYQRKGFKTCLICADTFRAGAFDQLKQNAAKAKIPFYGSYTETDPVSISAKGVEKFRAERFEVIIVDTSGRHRQEAELFEEMKQISSAVSPNLTIMVLDGAIGQAAESQSKAFKEAAGFGAIIVTKMDGHAKGGGAISAVAATKTPIMFIGTGEHLADLERFEPRPFISKMLGMGDLGGLLEHVKDVQMSDPKRGQDMMKKIEAGIFTVRDLRDQLGNVMKMGPLSKMASMIPGMGGLLGAAGSDEDASLRMKRMIFIMDSMTAEELDSDGKLFLDPSTTSSKTKEGPREPNRRILRVARGSGSSVSQVEEVLAQHKLFADMVKKMGGKKGYLAAAQRMQQTTAGGRGGRPQNPQAQMAAMQKMMSPDQFSKFQQMSQQMGGMGGLGGGMPDLSQLRSMMGGMGFGAGG